MFSQFFDRLHRGNPSLVHEVTDEIHDAREKYKGCMEEKTGIVPYLFPDFGGFYSIL